MVRAQYTLNVVLKRKRNTKVKVIVYRTSLRISMEITMTDESVF